MMAMAHYFVFQLQHFKVCLDLTQYKLHLHLQHSCFVAQSDQSYSHHIFHQLFKFLLITNLALKYHYFLSYLCFDFKFLSAILYHWQIPKSYSLLHFLRNLILGHLLTFYQMLKILLRHVVSDLLFLHFTILQLKVKLCQMPFIQTIQLIFQILFSKVHFTHLNFLTKYLQVLILGYR